MNPSFEVLHIGASQNIYSFIHLFIHLLFVIYYLKNI